MCINNQEKTIQIRIIQLSCYPNQNHLVVTLFSTNDKTIMIHDLKFLEWLLCNELDTFLNMAGESLYNSYTVEYGYYQGSKQCLGLFKHFHEDNFSEEMFHIILGYAKYMVSNHDSFHHCPIISIPISRHLTI